ncbi:MAG: TIGR02996 domain-containing protein, partial [Gemmataceae bacterium]|nr:TIGR02996 domain-containing protein [Gemmataceae bacterium]
GWAALGDGAGLASLRSFRAEGTGGDAAARAVAGASRWMALRRLALHWMGVGDEGASALAGARHLGGLQALDLRGNLIGRAGAESLGGSRVLRSLGTLELDGNPAPPLVRQAAEARYRPDAPPLAAMPAFAEPASPPAPSAPVVGDADEDGLVRAILVEPWDDLHRSAYADWLDEQGLPLQAELLRLPLPAHGRMPVVPLRERIEAALSASGGVYPNRGEEGLLHVMAQMRVFRTKGFQRRAPDVLRREHVFRLILSGATKDWQAVAESPALCAVRGLSLEGCHPTDAEAALLVPALGGLWSLHPGGRVDPGGIEALLAAPMPELVHLDLSFSTLTTEGLRSIPRACTPSPLWQPTSLPQASRRSCPQRWSAKGSRRCRWEAACWTMRRSPPSSCRLSWPDSVPSWPGATTSPTPRSSPFPAHLAPPA